jgi:hypothetical protein
MSATTATLERLRDRELIWELISRETEVLQEIEAVQARMMLLTAATTAVCERLDVVAVDAYVEEEPEAVAWQKERDDA